MAKASDSNQLAARLNMALRILYALELGDPRRREWERRAKRLTEQVKAQRGRQR